MERNRLSAGETLAAVRTSIEAHLTFLKAEIVQTEPVIQKHIRHHTALHTQLLLLCSIPGSGTATAAPPARCNQFHRVQDRTRGGGVCRGGPAPTPKWEQCAWTRTPLKTWVVTPPSRPVWSSSDGTSMSSWDADMGGRAPGAWEV